MSEQVEKIESNNDSSVTKSIIITKPIRSLTSPEKTTDEANQENSEAITTTPNALTEAQRLEMRMKKFGVQSENAKLTLRAERFGISDSGSKSAISDPSKLEKRAQRFGVSAPNTPLNNATDAATLEKRAKRFGANNESPSSVTVNDEALAKRKERFGIVDQEAKKKLRSERFANKV